MKTGSFVFQSVLDPQVCKSVGGGVSPNFNYQPPAYQTSITGTGTANAHGNYNYNVTFQVVPQNNSNISINASVSGNNYQAITDGSIIFTVGL